MRNLLLLTGFIFLSLNLNAQGESNRPDKYRFTQLGAYTWSPSQIELAPNVEVDRKGIPTIYYSGGRDLLEIITFNVELFFNWTQFEVTSVIQNTEVSTRSDYYAGGVGAKMEIKLPIIPSKKIEPYGQGSAGGLYQWINTTTEDPSSSYSINLHGFYYTVGGGAIIYLKDDFGLFAEAGSFWFQSKDTQADIIDEILQEQGVTGVSSSSYGTPNEPFKSRDNYFKLGILIRRPVR